MRASWGKLSPELEDNVWGNNKFSADSELLQDCLLQLNALNLYGVQRNSSQVKELSDVIARPLYIIFQWSWKSGEVPFDRNLANIVPVFKKSKKKRPWYLQICKFHLSGKIMKKIFLGVIEKH